jgi:hypothetical protein
MRLVLLLLLLPVLLLPVLLLLVPAFVKQLQTVYHNGSYFGPLGRVHAVQTSAAVAIKTTTATAAAAATTGAGAGAGAGGVTSADRIDVPASTLATITQAVVIIIQ